ncbi:MAG: GGDEF domain-containing protein [Alphaproteobacteria bacterium]|nr:GGDEF domain-containing protein [Alphaproteobacteria bacterium]
MQEITEGQEGGSGRDLVSNIDRIARYLKNYGRPQQGGPESEGRRFTNLALSVALEARERLVQQQERIDALERLASTDELTGLFNRRGFEERLKLALAESRRREERGILVYIDLDAFKPINDNFGHAAGDEVLRHVAAMLAASVRDTDAVARLGGDEFAMLLVNTAWRNGLMRARTLEKAINTSCVIWNDNLIAPKASFGIRAYGPEDEHHSLLELADHAMYATKRERRSEPRLAMNIAAA